MIIVLKKGWRRGLIMLKEFKEFAMKGNVVDMAVGIIIGASFGAIVNSFVTDIIMPPIGILLGNVDFSNLYIILKEGKTPAPYETLASANAAGAVTLNYGKFINSIISFLIVAFSVFLIIKNINAMRRKQESPPSVPTTKECPYCFSVIPVKAVKCPDCTSDLKN